MMTMKEVGHPKPNAIPQHRSGSRPSAADRSVPSEQRYANRASNLGAPPALGERESRAPALDWPVPQARPRWLWGMI